MNGGHPGLFPASFVTLDLAEAPVQTVTSQPDQALERRAQIDEEVLKKCIDLLEQCDPTGTVPDDPDLAYYEQLSMAQIPLVDQKLAQIDKQHNMLATVDVAIRDVLAHYDNAVQQTHYQQVGLPELNGHRAQTALPQAQPEGVLLPPHQNVYSHPGNHLQ